MSKIRINELARELEVKPNVILETLAELGIADKKTHSSSLDDDVALEIRRRVAGEAGGERSPAAREAPESNAQESTPEPARTQPSARPAVKAESHAAESAKETQEPKAAEE